MQHNEAVFYTGIKAEVSREYSAAKKPFKCSAEGNLCLENKHI